MRFSAVVFTAIALIASSVAAAPSATKPQRSVKKYDGEKNGKYIVALKANSSAKTVASHEGISNKVEYEHFNSFSGGCTFDFMTSMDVDGISSTAMLDDDALNTLLASDEVESVEEDGLMHVFVTQ
jgi:predicted transposase YbfD/YdcC